MWEESTTCCTKIWQNTIRNLPKKIFNFVNCCINNTLPTSKNMVLWCKTSNSFCKFCLDTQTLQHVVSVCKTALNEPRYNWRDKFILANLMKQLKILMNKQLVLYADIAAYKSPPKITGPSQRPDIVIVDVNKLYVIELAVGSETRIRINAGKNKRNYEQLCRQLNNYYDEVKYFNISMGAVGLIGKDSQEFCKLIEHLTNKQTANYIMNKISACCIRSTYYLFCRSDKPWKEPKLLFW